MTLLTIDCIHSYCFKNINDIFMQEQRCILKIKF